MTFDPVLIMMAVFSYMFMKFTADDFLRFCILVAALGCAVSKIVMIFNHVPATL